MLRVEHGPNVAVICLSFWLLMFSLKAGAEMKAMTPGVENGRLAPCPEKPNCAGSDATTGRHYIAPYRLQAEPQAAWRLLQEVISSLPRTEVIKNTSGYLHAESKSRLFGFVDDLEFHLRPEEKIIAVRSASRIGYWDLGVNRKRLEEIRALLRAQDAVE